MNQANQRQLFQATNQGLLGIRQSEINYYQSLTVAFGTQAALIGGFTFGVFTENLINRKNGYNHVDTLADCYWVCATITIALAVHVILCTMLMQVLGPGLSLNGPVGSMARATEGMRIEIKSIIRAFIAMMIMFAVATLLSCWVVMSFEGAIGCSVALTIAAFYWYKYCERIYLRFYWNEDELSWEDRGSSVESFDANDPTLKSIHATEHFDSSMHFHKTKRHINPSVKGVMGFFRRGLPTGRTKSASSRQKSGSSGSDKDEERAMSTDSRHSASNRSVSGRSVASRAPTLLSMLTRDRAMSEMSAENTTVVGQPTALPHPAHLSGKKGIVMEGYLTKRGGGTYSILDFRNEPWERRYFTLTNTCNLFVFKNRQDFRFDPKSPIYSRPLQLSDYYIEVHSATGETPRDKKHVLDTPDDDVANPFRFQMTLVLRENVHAFQNDQNLMIIGHGGLQTESGHGEVFNAILPSPSSSAQSLEEVQRARSPSVGSVATGVSLATHVRKQLYRDHWVLRCDTEEELHQWVNVITAMCPSCFDSF